MTPSSKADRQAARDRVAAMRSQQQAMDRRRRLAIIGAATAAVLAIAGAVTISIVREQASKPSLSAVPETRSTPSAATASGSVWA